MQPDGLQKARRKQPESGENLYLQPGDIHLQLKDGWFQAEDRLFQGFGKQCAADIRPNLYL